MARAMNGVAVPVFYQGQKVGEKRVFNERLTMFLLRSHAPERYGAWHDGMVHLREEPDGLAMLHKQALKALAQDAIADEAGRPRPARPAMVQTIVHPDAGEFLAEVKESAEDTAQRIWQQDFADQQRRIDELTAALAAAGAGGGADRDMGSPWPPSDAPDAQGLRPSHGSDTLP